jgi:hypothetical protein
VTAFSAENRVGTAVEPDQTLLGQPKQFVPVPLTSGPNDSNIARVVSMILSAAITCANRWMTKSRPSFSTAISIPSTTFTFISRSRTWTSLKSTARGWMISPRKREIRPRRASFFTRFLERLQQQHDYVTNLLATEKFDFSGDDRFLLNRKTMPRPKDMAEAHQLWRDRLRHEYLSEKLSIGRPEEIAKAVVEKLEAKQTPKEAVKAIEDKLSTEKAQEIAKLIEQKSKEKPEVLAKAIQTKLENENADEIKKIITRRYNRILRALREYDRR